MVDQTAGLFQPLVRMVNSAINKHDKHEMINLNGLFDCTIANYFGSHLTRNIYKLLFNT